VEVLKLMIGRILRPALAAASMLLVGIFAIAPAGLAGSFDNYYPGFFSAQDPGRFDLTFFGGGYGSDKYGVLQEGIQVEQTLTPYIGGFGRFTGYQLWIGEGFDSPLSPGSGHSSRLNFGRFQGGLDFTLLPGTHLWVSGGKDTGNSHADIVEGDFSSWILLHSRHPINVSFSSIHDWQNGVTSNEIDVQTIVYSTEKYMVMAGGGGAFYVGGFVPSVDGQGGPDIGFYYRPWQMGFTAQGGYGSAHQYGQLSMFKQLNFFEY
jgi:hypothetical protein